MSGPILVWAVPEAGVPYVSGSQAELAMMNKHSFMASALVLVSRLSTWALRGLLCLTDAFFPRVGFGQYSITATENQLGQKGERSQVMKTQTPKSPPTPFSKTTDPHLVPWVLTHKRQEDYQSICSMPHCDWGWSSISLPDTCHIRIWQVNQVPHSLSSVVTSPIREGGGVPNTGA